MGAPSLQSTYHSCSPSKESFGQWPDQAIGCSMTPTMVRTLIVAELCQAVGIAELNINLNASFMQLGGHSLSAIAFASACKNHGLYLSIESILRCKTILELLDCVVYEPLAPHSNLGSRRKSSVQSVLNMNVNLGHSSDQCKFVTGQSSRTGVPPTSDIVAPVQVAGVKIPITEMQMSLVHGSHTRPGTNMISFFETYLSQDVAIMKDSWRKVVQAEPIFRASFDVGLGSLIAQAEAPFIWTEIVVRTQKEFEFEVQKDQQLSHVGTHFRVVTLGDNSTHPRISTVIWHVHHALIDGFSAALIYKKVQAVAAGRRVYPGTPFWEVAERLKNLQQSSQITSQAFWAQEREKYPSVTGELQLTTPQPQSCVNDDATMSIKLQIPVGQLSACARESGISLASMYYAAWALALSIYTDSDEVVFGIVLSGRNLPIDGVEDTIGPLINTLPLQLSLDRGSTTSDYLQYVFNRMVELSTIQYSVPEDGYSRKFSSALAMEFDMSSSTDDGGVQPIGKPYFKTVTDVPLSVFMNTDGTIRLCYQRSAYKQADIELLGEHYRRALRALLSPYQTLEHCLRTLLPRKICEDLFLIGNSVSKLTTVSSVHHDDLVTLFERVVAEYPNNVAIEKGKQALTYSEMDALSNQVATHLSRYINNGDVVCVHADRSINWIVAIYGILKAGGVYSALDAALPAHVRDTNFQSAGSKIFLVDNTSQKSFKPSTCSMCFTVEELLLEPIQASETLRRAYAQPKANAYVCFTSGSTGKPKGVICSHEGLVAFQRDLEVRLFAQPGIKISQVMSPAFDGSIHEIFSALSYGATLVLAHSANPFSHLRLVDSAILTPSIAKMLMPDDFPKLRNVYLVGEPVPQHVNDIWASKKRLYNMYGPTETTCGATIKRLLPGCPVNIGVPNPSTRVYILDRNQSLVPPGVVGEIYIAGVQVARGYIGRPKETAKRFLVDTVSGRPEEMMYRTGDRAYWNSLGEIECLGRNDRQIKLRGFRLDLNDIEIRMAEAFPTATAVAVAPKDDYLVAMVQPGSIDVTSFRSRISQVLPVHALPRHIVPVDKFPLTNAGKIDYSSLANTAPHDVVSTVAPLKTSTERLLATAWAKALGVAPEIKISGESSFVSLGGHSILQLHLASRLTSLFGRQIPLRLIVQSATLRDLASAIDDLSQESLLAGSVIGEHDVSPIEREWWYKYQLNKGSSAFNVTSASSFDPQLVDQDKLSAAWNIVLERHRILRCRYVPDCQLGVRRAYAERPPKVQRMPCIDLHYEVNRQFKLDSEDLIRVIMSPNQLLVVISHIICDLTTLQLLTKEVITLYHDTQLPPVARTYMDTTLWNTPAPASDLAFWAEYLADPPTSSFPPRTSYSGSSHLCKVPNTLYKDLATYATKHKFTMHQLALGAVALALSPSNTSKTDIMLGGPFLNRPTAADGETVGLFLEPLPIRVRYDPCSPSSNDDKATTTTTRAFISSVRDSSQSSLAHAVPWNQLLSHLQISTSFPTHPVMDTMVTFHDAGAVPALEIRGMRPLVTWAEGAKFGLLVEFMVTPDGELVLRLEGAAEDSDKSAGAGAHMRKLQAKVLEALTCLVLEEEWDSARMRVRDAGVGSVGGDGREWFGIGLDEI